MPDDPEGRAARRPSVLGRLVSLNWFRAAQRQQGRDWQRWCRENIPVAEQLYLEYPQRNRSSRHAQSHPTQDWEDLELELHAAGSPPRTSGQVCGGCSPRRAGHQLAETLKQLSLGQKQIAAAMGVSAARVSQIEDGAVTSFEVVTRYVEALVGRLDLWPISATGSSGCPSATPRPPHDGNPRTVSLPRR